MRILDMFKAKSAAAPEPPRLAAKADRRGAPGTRIHHEYFVAEEPVDGRFPWKCRVYDADSTVHEMTGAEDSDHQARVAAIAWADDKKTALRGAP